VLYYRIWTHRNRPSDIIIRIFLNFFFIHFNIPCVIMFICWFVIYNNVYNHETRNDVFLLSCTLCAIGMLYKPHNQCVVGTLLLGRFIFYCLWWKFRGGVLASFGVISTIIQHNQGARWGRVFSVKSNHPKTALRVLLHIVYVVTGRSREENIRSTQANTHTISLSQCDILILFSFIGRIRLIKK